jgi:septum formation protein
VRNSSAKITDRAVTKVRFVRLTDAEIDDYVATGEPMDKAGGYAIQGRASIFVERIEGCFYNVMGLPIALVYQHLKAFDYP